MKETDISVRVALTAIEVNGPTESDYFWVNLLWIILKLPLPGVIHGKHISHLTNLMWLLMDHLWETCSERRNR